MIRCPKCNIIGNVIEFASSPMNVVQRHCMFCDHDWVLSWQQFEAECAPSNNGFHRDGCAGGARRTEW